MADTAIRAPRSLTEAQRLCEQWAELDGEVAAIEEARDAAIAAANAEVDKDLTPLVKRRDAIVAKLEPWWKSNAAELTKGKRKSAELGGVVLGTRTGRAKLSIAGKVENVVAMLATLRWAKPFLRQKIELDRVAIMRALDGKHAAALAEMGIAADAAEESFFIERTAQAGTQGKVS
jgi:phage host-nuclease inhibitor protein Gam